MRIQKIDNQEECTILTGMIVDKIILGRVSTTWNMQRGGLFRTRWSNIIGQWCVDFYKKYDAAPGSDIEALFHSWADSVNDKDTVHMIEKFIATLSEDYEELEKESSSEFIIDMAGGYFNRVRLEQLTERIIGDIESGFVEKAKNRVSSFGNIEMGTGSGLDIFQDDEIVKAAFSERVDSLITYPGALNKFFGSSLARDSFIAFMGPEKRGKTFWLLDVAFRAMTQRKKVAFFEVGDMSQNQIVRRFMARACRRPLGTKSYKYPIEIQRDANERFADVDHLIKKHNGPLSWRKAWKISQKVIRSKIKSQDSYLKLSVHPTRSITVGGINDILQKWALDGWVADVIVIDYADLLASESNSKEKRDQIDITWGKLRALSQTMHCLVATATQADTASYRVETLSMGNFSDSKTKNAHVTGIVGLNQTHEEKELGIMRLNWIVRREDEYSNMKCVHVAGCLSIANPAVRSTY